MSDYESSGKNGYITAILVLVPIVTIIAIGVGYLLGRASTEPETVTEVVTETLLETVTETVTNTVTEQIEVTRIITQEVEVPVVVGDATSGSGEIDLGVFYETWQLVETQFDGEIPVDNDIVYAAIEGSLKTLDDDFTRFVRPEVAARMREDAGGSVEGIGAFVRENDDGFFEIVRPIADQPAEKAGLLPGDIVIEVDGMSVEDVSFDEVILMVRGPRGTDVTLTIVREGEEDPLEFIITRARFEIPTVEYEMLDEGIGYIHLQEFNQSATSRTLEALEDLMAQDPQAIIFDLRDNPGGFLNESVSVADVFLPDNVVLLERNRSGLDREFRADDGDLGEEILLVVLVNPGSASASEIVAGALQDHGRAVLIGETTFGKGSVQQVLELSDGSELRVTIARWYTPNNNSIDKEGISPDIEVEMAFDAEEDVQLERAIAYILEGE